MDPSKVSEVVLVDQMEEILRMGYLEDPAVVVRHILNIKEPVVLEFLGKEIAVVMLFIMAEGAEVVQVNLDLVEMVLIMETLLLMEVMVWHIPLLVLL